MLDGASRHFGKSVLQWLQGSGVPFIDDWLVDLKKKLLWPRTHMDTVQSQLRSNLGCHDAFGDTAILYLHCLPTAAKRFRDIPAILSLDRRETASHIPRIRSPVTHDCRMTRETREFGWMQYIVCTLNSDNVKGKGKVPQTITML